MNIDSTPTTFIGILNFLTFGISIIAAVLAIDMYSLLRVGQSGRTWRILIVASVVFVLLQVLQLMEVLLRMEIANELSQIVALIFAMAFAYAFYRERANYTCKSKQEHQNIKDETGNDEDAESHDL